MPVIKLKMKFFIAYAVVFGLLAFEEIQAEAKIEASAAATKPFAAEQNFNLLKQSRLSSIKENLCVHIVAKNSNYIKIRNVM